MAEEDKIAFGRNMEPAEYDAPWADKLPEDSIVKIPAEDTIREIPKDQKDQKDPKKQEGFEVGE